jgi:LuxR family maltose regulon positive regulatory protein
MTASRPALQVLHRRRPSRVRLARPAGKLHPSWTGTGSVPRPDVVGRMLADPARIAVLAAPAGYGKTTVLVQWAARQLLPVAWLTADRASADPLVLLSGLAVALGMASRPVDGATATFPGPSVEAALTDLVTAISNAGPVQVVIDQAELIGRAESAAVVAALAAQLPPASRLAISTRDQPPLPMALLRSRGEVLEIGVDGLAMSPHEGRSLLQRTGATLDDDALDGVVEHTEGWPAALHIAGISARLWPHGRPGFRFRGDDRRMGDYLRSEVLGGLDPGTVQFLTRTSVLDRLAGPLCDAVLETHGSQTTLEALEAAHVPLVPLDEHRGWYRLHRLLRELLLTDLRHREPERRGRLHRRASAWFAAERKPELALHHSQAAGDPEQAARYVVAAGAAAYITGRVADLARWIDWFPKQGVSDRYPNVAILGALVEASRGRPAAAARWTAVAELDRRVSGRCALAGWRSYLRAHACRGGVVRMRADARRAQRELSPWSPLVPGAILLEGLSFMLEGEHSLADPLLARAHDVAVDVDALPIAAAALAERALIEIGHDDWTDAEVLVARATSHLERASDDQCPEAAIVFAVAARIAIHAGDLAGARAHVTRAGRLRPLFTYAAPWTAQFQIELARAHLELADAAGAKSVLRDVSDTVRQRPDLGGIAGDAERLSDALEAIRGRSLGATSLTTAELRLLPYLSTHLSFPDIGEALAVSRHTVKSQAISIYRKLGVSSRREAIDRAREVGLLAASVDRAPFTPSGR